MHPAWFPLAGGLEPPSWQQRRAGLCFLYPLDGGGGVPEMYCAPFERSCVIKVLCGFGGSGLKTVWVCLIRDDTPFGVYRVFGGTKL